MSFASPLWWWALAGLALPLAIHLLSRGRRQRIAIGSVRHLQGTESRALRRLKLSGLLQLLLRTLLLAALTLALAGPRWPRVESRSKSGPWVLIDPELLALEDTSSMPDGEFRRRMEAAQENASSIRLLAPGLPDLRAEREWNVHADAWSLLREADEMAPLSSALTVFTLDRKGWLKGRRPSFARQVEWWVLGESEPNLWIQRAASAAEGLQYVTVGESDSSATRFRTHSWPETEPPPEETGLRINADRNTVELRLPDRHPADDWVPVPTGAEPINLAMSVGADREIDEWYLRRALDTVGKYLGRELDWVEDGNALIDLEIRLGAGSLAGPSASAVLGDSDSDFESCQMLVYAASILGDPWVQLERCSRGWGADEEVGWWLDAWGRPFLSRRVEGSAAVFDLHSRFDSRWSTLVTSPVLPRLLLDLIAPENASEGGAGSAFSDRRATTGMERVPGEVEISESPSLRQSEAPEFLAWALVALLLVLERWISGRTP